jgi:hypothetical protein
MSTQTVDFSSVPHVGKEQQKGVNSVPQASKYDMQKPATNA